MLTAHTAAAATDTRAARPALTAVPDPRATPGAAGNAVPPTAPAPEAGAGEHSLLGVLPLPESGKYMLVYGVVVDEPHPRGRPLPPAGGLLLDRAARRVWSDGHEVELTYQEYELLECLTDSPGRAITRAELMQRVWGAVEGMHSRTIDVHIHRLRRKLGPAGDLIATVRKVGYIYQGPRALSPES
ncbi:winged helix-turn-helix domain-containing protein [Nocardiopsis flavescens]|uniref:Transcriptional regulatory protein, C terminal n=1 Tax=Nocardiopsis flavescens TaxID=758803 RepID=A0A1M6HC44_9ACTN|nr:winged helix-turn-helix domain-containing protein [Nocardiopsis flavescens]SHJ19770.1 Transcriptional regulatory protein, C terminal [Nocardiopsis flavescens]